MLSPPGAPGPGGGPAGGRGMPLEIACAAVLGREVEKLAADSLEVRVFHGSHPWGDQPCPLWVVDTLLGACVNVQAPLLGAVRAALAERPEGEPLLSKTSCRRILEAVWPYTPIASTWANYNFYTDRDHFVPWAEHPAVGLDPDHSKLRRVRTFEPVEDEGPVDISFGVMLAGKVVAYADVKRRTDFACSIGVWTDPPHRGRGMGKSAVSAATKYVLDTGRVALYIADKGNIASLSLCQSLGYQKFGEDLYLFRPK